MSSVCGWIWESSVKGCYLASWDWIRAVREKALWLEEGQSLGVIKPWESHLVESSSKSSSPFGLVIWLPDSHSSKGWGLEAEGTWGNIPGGKGRQLPSEPMWGCKLCWCSHILEKVSILLYSDFSFQEKRRGKNGSGKVNLRWVKCDSVPRQTIVSQVL